MTSYSPSQIKLLSQVDSLDFPAKQVDEMLRSEVGKRHLIELRDNECEYLLALIRRVAPRRLDSPRY